MSELPENNTGQPNDTQAIISTAIASAEPASLPDDHDVVVVVPGGGRAEVITRDREKHLPNPARKRGTATLHDLTAFECYAGRHDDMDTTTFWVDGESDRPQIVAVIDDHRGDDGPGWGQHRAVLPLKLTDEWRLWTKFDGQMQLRELFAEHVHDGLLDIQQPDAADMLEIVQSLQATLSATVKSGKRLHSGEVTFEYVEEQDASAGVRGELQIPQTLVLSLAPFVGGDKCQMNAAFRFRIRGGEVTMGYKLERPGDVLRDAVTKMTDQLGSTFEPERVFTGVPR